MLYNKSNKEFDRSVGFMFFKGFYEKGQMINNKYGPEKELEFYKALINYGLYQIMPNDEMSILTITELQDF